MTHVDPDIAVSAMTTLWRSFGNEISGPLVSTWRSMCDALNQAGQTQSPAGWTALAMPTGIGKTQFAALYCALMPDPALTLQNIRTVALHPGVLFVTRFISEANKFVERVNKQARRKVAAAYYHKSPTSLADAARFPVLAITHAACERHQLTGAIDIDGETVWDRLTSWHQTRRAKIIVDETPNFVTSVQINSNWLAQTLGALKWLPTADLDLYAKLEELLNSTTDARLAHKCRTLCPSEFEVVASVDTMKMREHLCAVDDYALALGCGSKEPSLRAVCNKTLSALEAIQKNGWAWLSYRGQTAQLNSATLHPSLRNSTGVILDGTAALYTGYELLSPPIKVVSAPAKVRHYGNVTLHLARGHKAGKGHLAENAKKLWPQYKAAIEAALPNGERVLVCSHKEFREQIDVAPVPRIAFAHFGEIDGRNDWEDYEAVTLLGLPYLDGATPANIAQALLGAQSTEWLQTPSARRMNTHDDILTALHRGHMSASAVQAISRVRCRSAIDSFGRCKSTSIFVALPNGEDGDAVLSAIVTSLPGVQVTPWNVDVAKRKQRANRAIDTLVEFFATVPTGVYTKAEVRAATRISPAALDRIIQRLKHATSAERRRLDDLRVSYYQQHGQGVHSYFVKA